MIAGAITSLLQKDQKKKHRTVVEQDDTPDINLRGEWNKRMRNAFGEQEPMSQPIPHGARRPATVPNTQHLDPDHPLAHATKRQQSATERVAAAKSQQRKNTAKSVGGNKIKTHSPETQSVKNHDYGRMVDEFDLERAVIYSEILKPKFEEY